MNPPAMTFPKSAAQPPNKKSPARHFLKLLGVSRPRNFRGFLSMSFFVSLRIGVFCYACLFVVGCVVADLLVFPAPGASYATSEANFIILPLGNGQDTCAFWRPNPAARKTVLYFHGNGEDVGHCRPIIDEFFKRGFSVLAVEYPGYGPIKASPSEDGCHAAAQCAYSFLRKSNIPPEDIVIVGYSLGTGVAVDLAAKEPSGAVILLAPFLSTFRVVTQVKIVPFDRFDSMAKIEKIKSPLLVIHGTRDGIVPFRHGKRLYELATETPRKQFLRLDGATHFRLLDSDMANALTWPAILAFLTPPLATEKPAQKP